MSVEQFMITVSGHPVNLAKPLEQTGTARLAWTHIDRADAHTERFARDIRPRA